MNEKLKLINYLITYIERYFVLKNENSIHYKVKRIYYNFY